jgi:hypothetical protein
MSKAVALAGGRRGSPGSIAPCRRPWRLGFDPAMSKPTSRPLPLAGAVVTLAGFDPAMSRPAARAGGRLVREWHMTEVQAVAAVQRQAERKRRRGYQ